MKKFETSAQFNCLFEAVADPVPQATGEAAWSSFPDVGALPPPWLTWTFICLLRHRDRQLWVGEIVRNRLGGDLGAISRGGAMAHPEDRPQRGPVPGLAEWEYYFHGCGCCLTHRVTGVEIDVDFFGDDAEGIDIFFFVRYLRSLRNPDPPEQRLIDLHRSFETIRLAFDELRDAELLTSHQGRGLCLSDVAIAHDAVLAAFCQEWSIVPKRAWLSARIGDWLDVLTILSLEASQEAVDLAAERDRSLRDARRDNLVSLADDKDGGRLRLLGLSDLSAAELPDYLSRAIRGPISAATCSALEIISDLPHSEDWCDEVEQLLRRVDSEREPQIYLPAVRILLSQGHDADRVAALLPRVGGYMVGEAALVAMEFAPKYALALFRRALRSSVPNNRMVAAAVLAVLDRPWSRTELLAVLEESDDQEATVECRAALAESRDPETRQTAMAWENRNPHEPEVGKFITMREMSIRSAPHWLLFEMDRFRNRILAVKFLDVPDA